MRWRNLLIPVILITAFIDDINAQCEITVSANPEIIVCGDCAELSAFGRGQGQLVFQENFAGVPTGWAFTQQARFDNPCSPNGVDGTQHIWMGNTSAVPRSLVTLPYNFSTATSGATVCFDMLFAEQGNTAPCEGPDEPDEGVYLQYQVGGGPWTTIHYFDPNGGNDPQLVNWNNWCFQLPPGASTNNVSIRWFQDNDSGADYDHWGLDNVVIYFNDPTYQITWQHDGYSYPVGSAGGVNPIPACPRTTTDFYVEMTNGNSTCRDTVRIVVESPIVDVLAGADTTICLGDCATLDATAKVVRSPGGPKTYFTFEPDTVTSIFGALSPGLVNINVTRLNMTNISSNSILRVCIDSAAAFDDTIFAGLPPFIPPIISDNHLKSFTFDLICPDGTVIKLIPDNVLLDTINNDIRSACFVAAGSSIASASPPYTGSFSPSQPLSNLNGCTANGIWTLRVSSFLGTAIIKGWSITFDDIEISAPTDFSWNPTTNMTNSNTLTPTVCPTTDQMYVITAQDTAGCVVRHDSINVIVEPNCCTLEFTATGTAPGCGAADGQITVNVTSGSGRYSFLWNDNSALQNRTGLSAGIYSVTVTDTIQNCSLDTTITLTSPGAPVINSVNVTHETCANDSDGTATVSASGGTGTLTYAWSFTTETGTTVDSIPAGNHTVTVTDANLCAAIQAFTINAGPSCCSLQIAATVVPPNCAQADGSIDITTTGSGNYSFIWSTTATSEDLTGVGAGTYSFTVTDLTRNCDRDTIITLTNPNAPVIDNITSTAETCLGDGDGTASVTASGGTGTLTYIWNTTETTQTITGLIADIYFVTVTDANFCETSASVTVDPGPVCCELVSTVDTVSASCNTADGALTIHVAASSGTAPFTYSIDGVNFGSDSVFSSLAAGNYNAIVRDANLCADTNSVTLVEANNTVVASVTSTNVSCFGDTNGTATVATSGGVGTLSILWSTASTSDTITNLAAGTYTVTVTDQTNCEQVETATISEPAPLTVNLGGNQSICTGDTAVLSVSDTFTVIQWSTTDTGATVFFTTSGSVSVQVTNANGCTATDAATIAVNNPPGADAGFDTTMYDFETVILSPSVTGAVNNSGFLWTPDAGLSCADCENPIVSADSTTRYYLQYTDLNGCVGIDSVLVTVIDGEFIAVVPNAFTPNGDGQNDVLYVYHKGMERMVFRIYNRWGSMIFQTTDPNIGWDGTFKGKELNPGVFVYELYAEFFNLTSQRTTRSVVLLR